MVTKTEKAYIKSSIPNNSVSEKILDILQSFDNDGGGTTLTTDEVLEGSFNKYYTDARVNSNINPKLALKSDKVLPVASQYVYVNYIAGNDSTGNGASDTPFKTINAAMASITDASQNKPYVVGLLGARQIETSDILVKPYTSIVGMGQRASYIRATGFNIKPDPSHSTGSSWVVLKNFYLGGGTGINWDLQALGGADSALIIENLTIGGYLTYKGRSTAQDVLEMYTCYQFSTVILDSVYSQIQTVNFEAAVNITNTQTISGVTVTVNNSTFNNSLYVTSTEVNLNNNSFPGISGLTSTGTVVVNSYRGVPPLVRRTLSVGTTLNESAETASSSEKYIKIVTLGDWSGPSAGEYTLTVAYSFHGITNPKAVCYETNGANFDQILVPTTVNASNDIIITVNETIDSRFLGKIVID